VSDATAGRITQIVPDAIPAEMIMYLINAIYFKGTWTCVRCGRAGVQACGRAGRGRRGPAPFACQGAPLQRARS
jgi:hypothetical protein